MPTKRSNGVYYVKRRWRGLDPDDPGGSRLVYQRFGTRRKTRAEDRERALTTLHGNGRRDLVRAFADRDVSIEDVEEAYQTDRTAELAERGGREDATVAEAVEADLLPRWPSPRWRGTGTGTAHFREFVGDDATARDALSVERIQEFKAHRLEQGRAPQTVNNDVSAVTVVGTHAVRRKWIEEPR